VIETVGKLLGSSVRNSDTAARYGGEEFVIILIETTLDEAERFAEKLRQKITTLPIRMDSREDILITASLGVSSFPEHSDSSQE
jgi:diguanylate cyclase (GGDEF)-like protein